MTDVTAPGWGLLLDRIRDGKGDPPPALVRLGLVTGLQGSEPGRTWGRWRHKAEYANPDGSLFGGYLAALADQILAILMMTVLEDGSFMTTADLRLTFFRPVLTDSDWEARVVHLGRRLAHVEVEFRDLDGEVLAKATATQVIVPGHVQARRTE